MKLTSAAANKMIRTLEDRKQYLLQRESNDSTYVLAEDEKEDIPAYDFGECNAQIDEIDGKIRILKHESVEFPLSFACRYPEIFDAVAGFGGRFPVIQYRPLIGNDLFCDQRSVFVKKTVVDTDIVQVDGFEFSHGSIPRFIRKR